VGIGGGNRIPCAPLHKLPVASPSTSRVFAIIGIHGLTFHLSEEEEEEEEEEVVVVVVVVA
jgi:hypothetical protein